MLLRYLSEIVKTIDQTVPDGFKDETLKDVAEFLRVEVRGVDSSLLDEWERMKDPAAILAPRAERAAPEAWDVTRDPKAFTVLIRNEMYQLLRTLSWRNYEAASELLPGGEAPLRPSEIEAMMAPFHAEHGPIRLDRKSVV